MYFAELRLYDEFGRMLNIIESTSGSGLFDFKNFPLIVDGALQPDSKVKSAQDVNAVAQLPPRLLQHARLDLTLLDGIDDSKVLGLDPGVNPICGWILPNHLDNSLLLYAPAGQSLGEFRLVQTPTVKVGTWQGPPHCAGLRTW